MGIEILMFGNIQIKKNYHHITPTFLVDVDLSFGEKKYKHFIGCLYNCNKVKPLSIILPETSACIKIYDGQTKWMCFFIEDGVSLEKYNTI